MMERRKSFAAAAIVAAIITAFEGVFLFVTLVLHGEFLSFMGSGVMIFFYALAAMMIAASAFGGITGARIIKRADAKRRGFVIAAILCAAPIAPMMLSSRLLDSFFPVTTFVIVSALEAVIFIAAALIKERGFDAKSWGE